MSERTIGAGRGRRTLLGVVVVVGALVIAACAPEPQIPPPPPPTAEVLSWTVAPGTGVALGQTIANVRVNGVVGPLRASQAGTMTANRLAPGTVVTPGAFAAELADARASFSTANSSVTIAAPGATIASTVPTSAYGVKSGTSMATPYVAAVVALVHARCGAVSPAAVEALLVQEAEDLGPPGVDPYFGAGMVRADRVLAADCPAAATASAAGTAPDGPGGSGSASAHEEASSGGPAPTTVAPTTVAPTTVPPTTVPPTTVPPTTAPTTAPTGATGATGTTVPSTSLPSPPTTVPPATVPPPTAPTTVPPATVPPPTVPAAPEAVEAGPPVVECADGRAQYYAIVAAPGGKRRVETFTAPRPALRQQHLERLEARGMEVLSVGCDVEVTALAIDDPVYSGPPGPQWGIDRVGFEAAWGPGLAQGAGARVAVIDSGVQADHPDLQAGVQVLAGADFLGVNAAGDAGTDSGTHGTHVAGIVGMRDNTRGGIGGAPQATLVPVRVLNGGSGSMSAVIQGIYWAIDQTATGGRAHVLNLSLGTSQPNVDLRDALEAAVAAGVTVVAAAGNCGCVNGSTYPAAYSDIPGVISVAATARTATLTMPTSL